MPHTLVYVSCSTSAEIQVFSLDATSGQLSFRQSCATPGNPFPLWASPDRSMLYAGLREPHAMAALHIDPNEGTLVFAGKVECDGPPAYVACDRNRRTLFAASYGGSSLSVSQLDADGIPQSLSQVERELPKAHSVQTDHGNRWLLVPNLGADAIRIYRLAPDGRVTPHTPDRAVVSPGSGPRHLVFTPDNRHVYCLTELACSIDLFDFDAEAGTLTRTQTVDIRPPGANGRPWASELRLSADGRFLYASERAASLITGFVCDPASGRMQLIGHFPTEDQPRGMGVDPSGRWLVAAGQQSGRLTSYAIDPSSGALRAVAHHATGGEPICVEIVSV